MRLRTGAVLALTGVAFGLGLLARPFFQRDEEKRQVWHPVTFVSVREDEWKKGLPLIDARDIAALRDHAGKMARVRGFVERVGHSERSHTYFLTMGSRRSQFTGVIFRSHARAFESKGIHPKNYEGKVVEITGRVRDDPTHGLEIFIEDPRQIRSE